MKRRNIALLGTAAVVLVFLLGSYFTQPSYTARVVDAETGSPIEGAVYLATWWKTVSGKKAWFEGPSIEMAKFIEGYSDSDGLIKVPWYWWRIPVVGRERSLTVYKPGYALWNSEYVFPSFMKKEDFGIKETTVALDKWIPSFSYSKHSMFLNNATKGSLTDKPYFDGERLLARTIEQHESLPYRKERMEGRERDEP